MARKPKKLKPATSRSDFFDDLKHLPLHQWATATIAILGISASSFSSYIGNTNFALVSLLSTVAISSLINNLDRAVFQKKAAQDLGDILSQQDGLRYIGGIPEAVDWFVRNADDVVSVRKTVQHPPEHETDTFDQAADKFGNAMRRCLDRGCSWNELALFPHRETVERSIRSLPTEYLQHYKARYLEADIPVPQIMILRFKNKRMAALVGFTFNGGGALDHVFLAEDNPATEYFDKYFSALLEKGKRIELPTLPPLPNVQRRGLFGRNKPQ